jgi:hypothetical protein
LLVAAAVVFVEPPQQLQAVVAVEVRAQLFMTHKMFHQALLIQ